jgi:FlaA1/EpsC-like NDP-sugar epimerase
MNKPRGYTIIDIIGAIAVVMIFILVVIIVASPKNALESEFRNQQISHVDDYLQSLLQLREFNQDRFDEVMAMVQDKKVMIGIGEGCDGSFGSECVDDELSDICLNLEDYLPEKYDENLLYDTSDSIYSMVRTGYYLSFKNDVLEVGACSPIGIDPVRLMSLIN